MGGMVTDPEILAQLNGGVGAASPKAVTDPALLNALNQNAPFSPRGTAEQYGVGLAKSAVGIAGLAGDAMRMGRDAFAATTGRTVEAGKVPASEGAINLPGSQQIQNKIEQYTGPFRKPQNMSENVADTLGQFSVGATGPVKGLAMRVLGRVVAPTVGNEIGRQAYDGSTYQPYAQAAGSVMGAVSPSAMGRVFTPFPALSAERSALAKVLEQAGVQTTAGQRTGNKALQYAESVLGDFPGAGNKATIAQENQARQFTGAALREMGVDRPGKIATKDVVAAGKQDLSDSYDALTSRNSLNFDHQTFRDLSKVLNDYDRILPSQQKSAINSYIDDIITKARSGNLPGDEYQAIRSLLGKQAEGAMSGDANFGNALKGIQKALDGAMGRSISPADKAAWDQTNKQYGAFKAIQKAGEGAGEQSATGYLSPARIRNAANVGTDLERLGEAGVGVMSPLPQSGTAPRVLATTILGGAGGLAGSAAGPAGTAAGIATGVGIPAMAGRILMSKPAQSYLGNQALAGPLRADKPISNALIQLLLNEPSLQPKISSHQ